MVFAPPELSVNISSLTLKNPIMTASGTFGYGQEYASFVDLDKLGAIIVKGISLGPRSGNPFPRIAETTGGMLNSVGLENIGVDRFISEKLPYLIDCGVCVIVNLIGNTIDEYCELAKKLEETNGIKGVELNISCPNVKEGGIFFGTEPTSAFQIVSSLRRSTKLPLIVKLSPNVTDITVIARSVQEAGADAISLINTITGMAIDIETKTPKLATITGGLSGPAIKPIALRMVWEVSRVVGIPVIGIGGIMNTEDALEFIIAGASAIQIGTANFINPKATIDILLGIEKYLTDQGIDDIRTLIGTLKV
ncbi:MAG: dihydroorotate dehydrogenase [Thermodesulfobacteriota bacterium]|nr:dihydroorotate dehydrogenase [Thermodesulfobacteriota bacterium]